MKVCPICETENAIGAKSCECCGEPLTIDAAGTSPKQPTPKQPTPEQATRKQPAPNPRPVATAAKRPQPAAPAAARGPKPPSPETKPRGPDLSALSLDDFDALLAGEQPSASPLDHPADASDASASDSDSLTGVAEELGVTADALRAHGVQRTNELPSVEVIGTASAVARVVIYENRHPIREVVVQYDEMLIGRTDPASESFADIDLSDIAGAENVSRRHAKLLRQSGKYYIMPLSSAGTQVGNAMVEVGDRELLESGTVLVLGGALALKFLVDA